MFFSFVSFFIAFFVFVTLLVHLVHFDHLIRYLFFPRVFVVVRMSLLVLAHFACKLLGLRTDLLRGCRVGCHGVFRPSIFSNLLNLGPVVLKCSFLYYFCSKIVSLSSRVSLFEIGCRCRRIAFEREKEFLNPQSLECAA